MRTSIYPVLLAIFFGICACSRTPNFPNGVSVDIVEDGTVVVTLEPDAAILVRQYPSSRRYVLVGNMDDILQIQHSEDTSSSQGLDILSPTEARYSALTIDDGDPESSILVFDDNGDGIPDRKIEYLKKFKLRDITWEPVETFDKTEQDAAANP